MSDIWNVCTLSECLLKVIDYRGKTPKKLGCEWTKSGYKAISANNVKFNGLVKIDSINFADQNLYDKWMKEEVENGDLLLTSEAPAGQIMLWDSEEKIILSQRVFALRTNNLIYNKYLKYYIQSEIGQKEILRNNSGSTVAGISAKTFSNILVRYPTKVIQQLIGDLLYRIDKKIEINNQINTELESMAKTLYDYWFVQFDFPDENGKPYKSSGGKMAYNSVLKREIPEGWSLNKVEDVFETVLGGTPSTKNDKYWINADIHWLSSAETAHFPIVKSDQKITSKGLDNSAASLLPAGTVVISIVRYIRPSILGIDAATNQSVVGIKENNTIKNSFIYPYFCSETPRLMGLRAGAQQPHINKRIIDESLIVLPHHSLLFEYYEKVGILFDKIIVNAKENLKLIELRDFLIPMLMNGQVTIKE